jgi:hypothetical protein
MRSPDDAVLVRIDEHSAKPEDPDHETESN